MLQRSTLRRIQPLGLRAARNAESHSQASCRSYFLARPQDMPSRPSHPSPPALNTLPPGSTEDLRMPAESHHARVLPRLPPQVNTKNRGINHCLYHYTTLGAPDYNYSIMGPETLF